MQPPDQEPMKEEGRQDQGEASGPETQLPAESAAPQPRPAPDTGVLPEYTTRPRKLTEYMIQPGVSYPPPPAYYEDMQDQPEKLSLPVLEPRRSHILAAAPSPWLQQAPGAEARGSQPFVVAKDPRATYPKDYGYGAPGPDYPPPYQHLLRPRPRRPNKWAWIVITVASLLLFSSCALVAWSFYTLVTPSVQQLFNGVQIVNDYYDALQAKNYTAAYRTLSLEGKQGKVSAADFAKQAQAQDTQKGSIVSYSVGQPSIVSNSGDVGTDVTEFTVTVNVTRAKQQYNVNLDVKKLGASWKIVGYDQL